LDSILFPSVFGESDIVGFNSKSAKYVQVLAVRVRIFEIQSIEGVFIPAIIALEHLKTIVFQGHSCIVQIDG
jgi:hypothetical protein